MNKLFSTKSKYKNEKGFGALEFLLVIVLIVSIGLAGWFVFRSSNQNTPNENNTSTEDSRTTSSSDQSDQNSLNNKTQKESEYLDIVELGIKIPKAEVSYKDLKYKITKVEGTSYTKATVYSESLDSKLKSMYPDLANAPMATNPSSIEVVLVSTRDFDEWERVSYPTDGGELTLDMSAATIKGNEVIVFSPTIVDMGSEFYQFRDSFIEAIKTLSDN